MTDHGERRLRNRIIFKLTGRWPQNVVASRLANTTFDDSNVRAALENMTRPTPPAADAQRSEREYR